MQPPAAATTGPVATELHASCVALPAEAGRMARAVLILGPSGSGKSELAVQLVALGAVLVADDRTRLALRNGRLVATVPPSIRGMIEVRGIGILRLPALAEAELALAVDLGQREPTRLPPHRRFTALGRQVPLLHAVETACFPSAVMLYLRHGRSDQE
jgi:HPr kinase/phosphorylase